jgi:hypothetical protein
MRYILLLVLLVGGVVKAEENPLTQLTKLTQITQLTQLKEMFVKPASKEIKSDDPMVQIHAAATELVNTVSTPDIEKKWNKKFKSRIKTRADDFGLTDNDAANELVLEWLTPRRNQVEWNEYESLELSRMFLYYADKNWELPDRVQQYLNSEEGKKTIKEIFHESK